MGVWGARNVVKRIPHERNLQNFIYRIKTLILLQPAVKVNLLNDIVQIEELIRKRLSVAITTSGLTLTQIAQAVGISIPTVSYYKNREKLPTVPTLAVLCAVLDISADELLGLSKY